jgi:hypothetical protein
MKRNDLEEKLFDLLHGNLLPDESDEILKELEDSGIDPEEMEEIRSIIRTLADSEFPHPSEKMDKRFYTMLEDEKRKMLPGEPELYPRNPIMNILKGSGLSIAAGISLFLLGWFASGWFGTGKGTSNQVVYLADQVKGLKETLVLTMMQQTSSVERIKAVTMTNEFDNVDGQIITSLMNLLNNDSNDNVRLLALEALTRYTSLPEVRSGLISSISTQQSPMIQIRLAEIMMSLNEKRAVPAFQKVLQYSGLHYNVRGKMNEALAVLL